MNRTVRIAAALVAFLLAQIVAPVSAQTLRTIAVAKDVYAIVGPKEQRSPENLGNNATFGAIVTDEGVILIDPGGSWNGAVEIEKALKAISPKPVRIVINTGGQDHRWLGNGYWRSKGAQIIAAEAAVSDQKDRGPMQIEGLKTLLGERFAGTVPAYADVTFKSEKAIEFGGVRLLVRYAGPAHTPGDSFVWLPDRSVMFSGDIVYTERILGVGPQSNAGDWIKAFDALAAFNPKILVPGHGGPADLNRARLDTRDYLAHLRTAIKALIDGGGSLASATKIDQSAFKRLEQFESLARRNAAQVFTEMELE